MQIHGLSAGAKVVAVTCAQYRPATRRQHTGRVLGQLAQYGLFKITKNRLAFALEKFPYRTTYALFYDLIRIVKPGIQPPRQLPTHC